MLKNRQASIPRSPVKKSFYFLLLIHGEMVEWWVQCQDEWLEKVEDDDPTAWQVLEQKFKTDFFDYAGDVIAQQQIRKLRMKDGNGDKYIADFKELARRAEDPKTSEQWAKAAQQQQKNWLEKQRL
jgi:DNA-binding GntR family transcriptional regulator